MERLLTANVLSQAQQDELTAYRDNSGPAQIARGIAKIQRLLLKWRKRQTDQLYLASIPSALPDERKGIRVKASQKHPIFRGHIHLRHRNTFAGNLT